MNPPPRTWPIRLALLGLALVSAGALVMLARHRSARPVVGPYSPPAFAALLCSAAATLGAAVCMALPNRTVAEGTAWLRCGLPALRAPVPPGGVRDGLPLGLLAFASYGVIALRYLAANGPSAHAFTFKQRFPSPE